MKKIVKTRWFSILFWVVILAAVWEAAAFHVAATKRNPENILPHLYQIIAAAFSTQKVNQSMTATQLVLSSAATTVFRAALGFAIGVASGFVLALLMNLSGIIEKIAFPYLMIIQMIPILGMAPIILSITGSINVSRILIAAILTFYPVATNTLAGFKSVEKEKYELMASYAAKKRSLYTKVLIPQCIPYFFTGMKISAPMAITAAILVDTLQGDGGLGCVLSQSLRHAMSISVFWLIVFFSAFLGIISWKLMGWLEVMFTPQKRHLSKKKQTDGKDVELCTKEKNRSGKSFLKAGVLQR